ncbi:uncharacterized protein LOC113299590 isoform X2 [Papaver somniferum]|uniref:uncharacterized protein LOC113299590 isoform X2 n=1 Tax=Papaver somniferum TaxID=3469 RepID=UPI000E6FBCBC|nr:uncharacterized protein LOC113299590 isoform X2 [Papaver somniferum]
MFKNGWINFFSKWKFQLEDYIDSRISSTLNTSSDSSSDEGDTTKSNGIGNLISGSVAQPSESQDFCVDASEEAKSVSTFIRPNSSSQVHNNVESQKVKSNPSTAVDKEDDGSTDFVSFQLKDIDEAEVNHIDSTNLENSNGLAVFHNKLNCLDCFHIGLDDSRSIFDRV